LLEKGMKKLFPGFYPPSEEQYKRLWNSSLVVVDTNVLLDLYRLPTTAREEFLSVLNLLQDRLWIPYQVALEFQKRRLTVIAAERRSTESILESARGLVSELRSKVEALEIDKRGLGLASQPLLQDLEQANTKLVSAISAVHKLQVEIASVDPVRSKLDEVFEGRVGVGPSNQAALDELIADGDERYKKRIPPGFGDVGKEKNPNEATFIHDHIKYDRVYGDLILWRQLLAHARASKSKVVLFVTGDKKEDWWSRENGKTIGPHPELISEIRREADVELFWMYSAAQFMEVAPRYTTATVSTQSVAELQEVARTSAVRKELKPASSIFRFSKATHLRHSFESRAAEEAIAAWVTKSCPGDLRRVAQGFPDIIVNDGSVVHGFEIKHVSEINRLFVFSPILMNALLRGYIEKKEGRLSKFTLIVRVTPEMAYELSASGRDFALKKYLAKLLASHPIDAIVVGSVIDEIFEPRLWQSPDTLQSEESP
jgi:hypothetical protein